MGWWCYGFQITSQNQGKRESSCQGSCSENELEFSGSKLDILLARTKSFIFAFFRRLYLYARNFETISFFGLDASFELVMYEQWNVKSFINYACFLLWCYFLCSPCSAQASSSLVSIMKKNVPFWLVKMILLISRWKVNIAITPHV